MTRIKDDSDTMTCFSGYKIWAKSIWSSTKKKRVRSGLIFSKKGEKVVFDFQHFVKPEQIIKEYIEVNIYNKSRLVKADKKESSSSDNQAIAEVDLRCKSKSRLKRERSQKDWNTSERKISEWRLNKFTESTRKTGNVAKRISATHNFVYEFNPLANSTSTSNDAIKRKGAQYISNIGQGDSPIRSTSNKNFNNVHESLAAALPKLHSRNDTTIDNLGKQKNVTSSNKNTNLPRIKGPEGMADQLVVKDREKLNPVSEIDREVEKVKSDWQILRSNNEWMQSKCLANPRTRKLYDTLEKMTREIDKIQNSYLDPKSNHYLQRGVAKTLVTPQRSFEEKAGQIKNMLYPKHNKKTVNETNNVPRNTMQSEVLSKEMFTSKESRSRSLLSSKRNLNSGNKPNSSNFNKQNINATDQKTSKKTGSDIREYLENYISDTEKNFVNKQESNIKEFNTSQDEVEQMLKKLNIQSFDMYDIADSHDEDEDSPVQNIERKKNTGTSARSAANEKIEKLTTNENTVAINPSLKEDSMRYNMLNANTSVQTNSKSNYNTNAFIEMGMSALNTNLPQDALSRILQSEYLKKDMSLKPM